MAKPKLPVIKLTQDNKLLIPKNGNSHFQSQIKIAASRSGDKEALKQWSKLIKPSSLTFDMCIEDYQLTCDQKVKYPLKTRLKFIYGNAIHKFIGQYLVDHCPELYRAPDKLSDHARKWFHYSKPEVPIVSTRFMTKALMDFPAMIQKRLIINDWKTTWENEANWTEFLQKPRIKSEYICQGASYCYLSTEEEVFTDQPEGFSLTYINMKEDPEERDMWSEVYFDYAPYAKDTEKLWALLLEATQAKIQGGFLLCANDYCRSHGRAHSKSIGSVADPWNPITPPSVAPPEFDFIRDNVFVDKARKAFAEVEAAYSHLGSPKEILEPEEQMNIGI